MITSLIQRHSKKKKGAKFLGKVHPFINYYLGQMKIVNKGFAVNLDGKKYKMKQSPE